MTATQTQRTSAEAPANIATDTASLTKLKPKIAKAIAKIIRLKAERNKVNESIAAVKSEMVELGVNKKGFMRALTDYELDDARKRRDIDVSHEIAREAMDIQLGLELEEETSPTVQ